MMVTHRLSPSMFSTEPDGGAGLVSHAAPHAPQKRNPGGFSSPHAAHWLLNADPHWPAIASRQAPPPAEGARVDVYFEGPVTGAKFSGSVRGVDYLHLRADGRFELDIYAEITTDDGKKIALAADGVALGEAPVLQLRENVKLTTSHPEHAAALTLGLDDSALSRHRTGTCWPPRASVSVCRIRRRTPSQST
jgi:hypothetical protein